MRKCSIKLYNKTADIDFLSNLSDNCFASLIYRVKGISTFLRTAITDL